MLITHGIVGLPGVNNGWDVSLAKFSSVELASSTEETSPRSIYIKPDGQKLYLLGDAGDDVNQYSLSTPWDLSTATFDSVTFSVSSENGIPVGLFLKNDGTKLYVSGVSPTTTIYQYTLSTAWASSTASYDGVSFTSSSNAGTASGRDFFIRDDGEKLYLIDVSSSNAAVRGRVHQFSFGTPWASSTLSYDDVSLSVHDTVSDNAITGLFFRPDGVRLFLSGAHNGKVYQFSLSTPWDVSTASYDSISFGTSQQDISPSGLFFKPDGLRMYIPGLDNDHIYQYSL